jgi:RNA polymerase sigma-70 factor (ECF subfamily)
MAGDRPSPIDEARLVREVAAGSQVALEVLYDRHADAIYAAATRLTSDRQIAEEVVQETFLALWNRAELYDPRSGSLAAWLHAIGRNRAVDRLRAAGRRPNLVPFSAAGGIDEQDGAALDRIVAAGTVLGGASPGPGPEAALGASELRETIAAALDDIPELERTVILLAYREELSQSEIAARLGWPLGTVKTRTRRALLHLRRALGGAFEPEHRLEAVSVPARERLSE